MSRTLAISLLASLVTIGLAEETRPCNCDCAEALAAKKSSPIQRPDAGKVVGRALIDGDGLPGSTITLENRKHRFTQFSDVNGQFEFFNVPPGKYRVSSELVGLKSQRRKDVEVVAGQTSTFEFRMKVDASRMICVDCGNAFPVTPDGPHFVITREMMENLPLR